MLFEKNEVKFGERMVDFSNIENYCENNRNEVKKVLGGLSESIWETYFAFTNTLGGVILLGVEEHKVRFLHIIDLPEPENMVREFWELLNDPKVAVPIFFRKKMFELWSKMENDLLALQFPRHHHPIYWSISRGM